MNIDNEDSRTGHQYTLTSSGSIDCSNPPEKIKVYESEKNMYKNAKILDWTRTVVYIFHMYTVYKV